MRLFRLSLLSLIPIGFLAAALGCSAGKPGGAADSASGGNAKAGKPSGPARQFKPADQLKNPEGVEAAKITDSSMPKSSWQYWNDWSPGDYYITETTNEGTLISRSRWEIVDLADHVIMNALDTTVNIGGTETKSRSALKFVFNGADAPAQPADPKYKWDKKPDARKFKVGNREYTSDTRTDTYEADKLLSRTWTTKELPEGVSLFTESADGKSTTRLVEFVKKGR